MRHNRTRPAAGFTMIELLIVVLVIGILIGFILVAAADGVRRAEEKATLALITKLEVGISERMEAILIRRADVYPAHALIAQITTSDPVNGTTRLNSSQRAQVIAQFDLVRSEFPDVFVPLPPGSSYWATFGVASDFPVGSGDFSVPLGASVPTSTFFSNAGISPPSPALPITGNYGASWGSMAGIHKNLGCLPAGYDGVDNNGNGLVDEVAEGTGGNAQLQTQISAKLASHQHRTARSEMLYAVLVEGQGPLGSVFAPDEFTSREVADTDNDGLPEFIDAWGQPLQFYRWPVYYNPDFNATVPTANYIQKGRENYLAITEPRQLDPLDPAQLLTSPSWFDKNVNATNTSFGAVGTMSQGVTAFEAFFHSIHDPFPPSATGTLWDRSGAYPRRAYYSRPLVLSAGPDKLLGVANYSVQPTGVSAATFMASVLLNESPAEPHIKVSPSDDSDPTGTLAVNATDDISNFSLSSPGGGVR